MSFAFMLENKLLRILSITLLSFSFGSTLKLYAIESDPCFYRHIDEAIEINLKRRSGYLSTARYKGGFRAWLQTRNVSSSLIVMERGLLLPARKFDIKAAPFKRYGIPLMCNDLIEMSETPKYKSTINEVPGRMFNINISKLQNSIRYKLNNQKWSDLDQLIENKIIFLKSDPYQYCLTRHFLESILRTLRLIPIYQEEYLELPKDVQTKLGNPKKISLNYIKLHLIGFRFMDKIDRQAYLPQKLGIPIVCRDVPTIPYELEDIDYRNN